MRLLCRRAFSTSTRRLKTSAVSQKSSRRTEEIDERFRDPPPPANFPVVCPRNPKLKFILDRIGRNVFQRNGLHKIPYRNELNPDKPVPVYDGESWPEADQIVEKLSTINVSGNDVIDVQTQQTKEARIAEETKIMYHDISHEALRRFLAAIKNPIELRLLPHIIREWHRRSLPITLVDAQRIARLATKLNEVDVVLQMTRPDVYGLYYNMQGIREITRGMARRVSLSKEEEGKSTEDSTEKGRKPFKPDDLLHKVPELLTCAVGTDAKLLLRDPAVLGTQLWAFVERFNNDETFRTTKSLAEICGLAEKVSANLVNNNFGPTVESVLQSSEDRKKAAYAIKYESSDYVPVLYALRQFAEIIYAPYRACLAAFEKVKLSQLDEEALVLKTDIENFLNSKLVNRNTLSKDTDPESTAYQARKAQEAKWVDLNCRLAKELKKGKLHLPKVEDWQWDLLKQFTGPATQGPNASIDEMIAELFFAPIRGQVALKALEQRLDEWQGLLRKEHIKTATYFDLKVVKYGQELLQSDRPV